MTPLNRTARWALAAICLGGAAIRFVGVAHALPDVYHADEVTNLQVATTMVRERTLDPEFFNYPSLFFDVGAALLVSHAAMCTATGACSTASLGGFEVQAMGTARAVRPSEVMGARAVTAALSSATVLVVAWLAWLMRRDVRLVMLAATCAALSPILVEHSWFATPDALTGLLTTLTLVASLLVLRRPGTWTSAACGLALGLATSSKYNAAIGVLPVVLAHVWAPSSRRLRDLLIASATACVALLATSPYIVLDAGSFWDDFTFELSHYRAGHPGHEGSAWQANARWLWIGLGPLLLSCFAIGAARAARSRRGVVLLLFIGATAVAVSAPVVRFERNLVPIVPVASVLVALGMVTVADRTRCATRAPRPALAAAALAAFAWPAVVSADRVVERLVDPRAESQAWIDEHVPDGATIAIDPYSPFVDMARWVVYSPGYLLHNDAGLLNVRPRVVVVTSAGSGRWLRSGDAEAQATLQALRARSCAEHVFDDGATTIFDAECDGGSGGRERGEAGKVAAHDPPVDEDD